MGEVSSILRSYDGDKLVEKSVPGDPFEYYNSLDNSKHLLYQHINDDGIVTTIRLPLGSWDIMEALIPKILKYVPGDIVEVGMGESSTIFAKYALEAGVKLISCDIQAGGMFNVFQAPIFSDHILHIKRSEEFILEYEGEPSIVFLDAEHKYEEVKKEVDFFLPKLKPNGVMFLHDTFPPYERQTVIDEKGWSPGTVYKIRQELERNPDVDVLTFPYSAHNMGLTMVMKHETRNEFWRMNGREVDNEIRHYNKKTR